MTTLKAVVTFQKDSGLPEDAVQNAWHFIDNDVEATSVVIASIGAALNDFYCNVGAVSGQALMGYYSPVIADVTLPRVAYYDVGVGGSEIGTSDLLGWVTNEAGQALPDELACCLTYHADLTNVAEEIPQAPAGPAGDLHPRARRRGRIYLGPFATAVYDPAANTNARPGVNFRQTIKDAAIRLRDNADLASDSVQWAVYSPTDGLAREVVAGWVDDAWDIQRRRGLERTTRDVWV